LNSFPQRSTAAWVIYMQKSNKLPLIVDLAHAASLQTLGTTDLLTSDDALPVAVQVDVKGLAVSRETGHTAQQQVTTDDK
jgi:hypothetical protein